MTAVVVADVVLMLLFSMFNVVIVIVVLQEPVEHTCEMMMLTALSYLEDEGKIVHRGDGRHLYEVYTVNFQNFTQFNFISVSINFILCSNFI